MQNTEQKPQSHISEETFQMESTVKKDRPPLTESQELEVQRNYLELEKTLARLDTIKQYQAAEQKMLQQEAIQQAIDWLPQEVQDMSAEEFLAQCSMDAEFKAAYDFDIDLSNNENLLGL